MIDYEIKGMPQDEQEEFFLWCMKKYNIDAYNLEHYLLTGYAPMLLTAWSDNGKGSIEKQTHDS